MTTILASVPLGVMVSDSSTSDGDRVWIGPKVKRYGNRLFGMAGEVDGALTIIKWIRSGSDGKVPKVSAQVLVLSDEGLYLYSPTQAPEKIRTGVEAIGTGAKAAMAVFEALGGVDPQRAVRIVCNHDAGSRPPVRTYRLRSKE